MPNYLTKEEIRQWRSSLEKITLEEFAARLGKTVEESKPTNDVVDIVMSKGTSSNTSSHMKDGFSAIAQRAFERERKISHTPFSISKPKQQQNKPEKKPEVNPAVSVEVNIELKKSLTDREQAVLDYLLANVNKTVYAKDLAALLGLPRDYVYKYIKNLRAKIEGDKLQNCQGGGFILTA